MSAGAARRALLREPLRADATEEVQVEDILLEVYDEPAPATRRSAGLLAAPAAREAAASSPPMNIAAAIAAVLPPSREESAAVDALLRGSDPAFASFVARSPAHSRPPTYGAIEQDTPSVSPVALANEEPRAYGHAPAAAPRAKGPASRGAAIAMWTVALLVLGLVSGSAVAFGARGGAYARLREGANRLSGRASVKPSAPATQPLAAPASEVVAPAAPSVARPASAPAPSSLSPSPSAASSALAPSAAPAAAIPTVSVDSLPRSTIAADSALVTFPSYARGRRVFLDGRQLAVTTGPVKVRCGRHTLRIGSAGKPRVTELACGREITLR